MSVKSLSDRAHGSLKKGIGVLRPECRQRLSWKNHKRRTVRLLTRLLTQQSCSSTHLCVKRHTVFFWALLVLQVNGYYGQTNKKKVEDYRP